jgi:hypothetical protein
MWGVKVAESVVAPFAASAGLRVAATYAGQHPVDRRRFVVGQFARVVPALILAGLPSRRASPAVLDAGHMTMITFGSQGSEGEQRLQVM